MDRTAHSRPVLIDPARCARRERLAMRWFRTAPDGTRNLVAHWSAVGTTTMITLPLAA